MSFISLEIALREKLHKGLVSDEEIDQLRDAFNGFGVAIVHRRAVDDKARLYAIPENSDAVKAFIKAKKAFVSYMKRRAKGIFSLTGDELNDLHDGIDVVFPFLEDSFATCPRMMAKEIIAGRNLTGEPEHDRKLARSLD